jgi:phenylacetate-CoA ligase
VKWLLTLSMLNFLKKVYAHSPISVKRLYANVPFPVRMGRTYQKTRSLLRESERWSEAQLADYQREQLHRVLSHAYENVPYYRKVFDDLGLKPKDISEPEDLIKLPTLTRADIKQNYNALMARNVSSYSRHYLTTGGTTAEPLGFLMSNNAYFAEWAFIHNMWSRVGFDYQSVRLGVREFSYSGDKCWHHDPLYAELRVSTLAMTDTTLRKCMLEARHLGAYFIHGYPSGITVLARYIEQTQGSVPPFMAVFAGSEPMLPWQRELFERVFRCRVFTWYGQSEKVILAGECEESTHYHAYPQYGYMELVDKNGEVISKPGIIGELVGTGFLNYAMPFIRYRTGDYAQYVGEPCLCGRHCPLICKVQGRRKQDLFVGKEGQMIPGTAFYVTDWNLLRNVHEFQLEQNESGKVIIKVVPTAAFSEVDREGIVNAMASWAGDALDFEVMTVKSVERTRRGKVVFLLQNLNIPDWAKSFTGDIADE